MEDADWLMAAFVLDRLKVPAVTALFNDTPPFPVIETAPEPALSAPLTAKVPPANKLTAPPLVDKLPTEILPLAALKFNPKLPVTLEMADAVVMEPTVEFKVNEPPYPE